MDFHNYRDIFKKNAINAGYTEQNLKKCLEYAKPLIENNLPVIYNTTHLSALVGYEVKFLKKAVLRTDYYYREFEILKRNGTKRKISEPLPSLKEIQDWILKNVLYKVKVSPFAKAYKPKTRLIENLKFHRNQAKLLTLDLENFFTSIRRKNVETLFKEMGYSSSISNLLSKLCCKDDSLPQGASTSPYLSNIFFIAADKKIADYCLPRKIRYTRYADDLSFSGDFNEDELVVFVTQIVNEMGLKINAEKIKLMTPNMRQLVTGIVVNTKPQVIFYKRNELRKAMHYIRKFGMKEHMEHEKIKKANYLEHLLGKINFVVQINPHDKEFQDYKAFLIDLKVKSHAEEFAINHTH